MDPELIASLLVFGLALLPVAIAFKSPLLRVGLVLGWIAIGILLKPQLAAFRAERFTPEPDNRPVERVREDYVSSKQCGACHPHEYDTWKNTWHRTMTQVASPVSVVGNFENVELEFKGWKTRLERRGDEFFAKVYEPDRQEYIWRKIVMTTGSHHMQAYWYSRGRNVALGQLQFTYLIKDAKWVPRASVFLEPPYETPIQEAGRWNDTCILCHTTRGQPGIFDNYSEEARSNAVEFGIACEACHGPGGEHVGANRTNPLRRYAQYLSEDGDETIVNAARLSKQRSVEVCGQCHGISTPHGEVPSLFERGYDYVPGDVLDETGRSILRGGPTASDSSSPVPEEFHDNFFWRDGMVRVSGRESNGMYESPCFERGEMTCLSCHTLHKSKDDPRSDLEWADDTLGPDMRSNQACLQCHEAFATNVEAHTHHAPESSGSECMNCHMPYTTWGLMKAIRQHTVDSPTVLSDIESGRPNACNSCHIDETLAWTANQLSAWYGHPVPDLSELDGTVSSTLRWLFTGDAGQRALAAWFLGWEPAQLVAGNDWIAPQLAPLLEDPYAVVRYVAAGSLRSAPGFESFDYDFVGSEAKQESAKLLVWETHAEQGADKVRARIESDAAMAARLLFYADGIVDRVALTRLLEQRDERDVNLLE